MMGPGFDLDTSGPAAAADPWQVGGGRDEDRQDRLIPMVNLVFILLTFFLVAGTFQVADTLPVEPATANTEGALDPRSPILYMDSAGALALAKERLDMETAVTRIKTLLDRDPDAELEIKADKAVQAAAILPLLRQLKAGGITSVRLITIKQEAER